MDHEPIEPPPILVSHPPVASPAIEKAWTLGSAFGVSGALFAAVFIFANIIGVPFALISLVNLYTTGKFFAPDTTAYIDQSLSTQEVRDFTAYLKKKLPDTDVKVQTQDSSSRTAITLTMRKGPVDPVVLEPALESGLSTIGIAPLKPVKVVPKVVSPSMDVLLSDPWILIGGALGFQIAIFAAWQFSRKKIFVGERVLPPFHSGSKLIAIAIGAVLGVAVSFSANFLDNLLRNSLNSGSTTIWDSSTSYPLWAKIGIVLVGAIGAPIFEEIFFRGILIGIFQKVGRPWLGVILSGIVFGLSHFQDVSTILTITVMGFILGATYVKTKSIYATIAMHMVNNMISFGFLFLGKP